MTYSICLIQRGISIPRGVELAKLYSTMFVTNINELNNYTL